MKNNPIPPFCNLLGVLEQARDTIKASGDTCQAGIIQSVIDCYFKESETCIPFEIKDVGSDDGLRLREGSLKGTIKITDRGIFLNLDGYGEKTSELGYGEPVFIELLNGVARVVVFEDINDEDPSYLITLERALETNREGSYKEVSAARVSKQVGETIAREGCNEAQAVRDALTDFRHYCVAKGIDFDKALAGSQEVFSEELADGSALGKR